MGSGSLAMVMSVTRLLLFSLLLVFSQLASATCTAVWTTTYGCPATVYSSGLYWLVNNTASPTTLYTCTYLNSSGGTITRTTGAPGVSGQTVAPLMSTFQYQYCDGGSTDTTPIVTELQNGWNYIEVAFIGLVYLLGFMWGFKWVQKHPGSA